MHVLPTQDFFEPDGPVHHPTEFWTLRIDKDEQGDYLSSAPWHTAPSPGDGEGANLGDGVGVPRMDVRCC